LNQNLSRLILKQGREVPVERGHPWVFSGAVANVSGNPKSGETVQVFSDAGDPLGSASFSPISQIRARMWSWDPQEEIDKKFFETKLRIAINTRKILFNLSDSSTNAYRLIHAESDFLPGLIVDMYANFLVVQYLSAGAEYWREEIADLLENITGIINIYERSDVEARRLEGLTQRKGVLKGEQPPEHIEIHENGLRFLVDIRNGQKTGF
jgi:23S rRNA (cytosine1962-C5)-methyltransferase